MIQNWKTGAVLLLLLAAPASAVWTFLGGFAQLPEGAVIEGENGAGIAVPNYVDIWARRLIFYYNATEAGVTIYSYSPAYYRVEPEGTWYPKLNFLFTVRSGAGPLVKSLKPFRVTTAEFGGGVKANLTLYDAEPGDSRIYVVLIEVRGGVAVEDPNYPSPPWEKITKYTVYRRFSGVVKRSPTQDVGGAVVWLYVFDISPDVIRQRRGGPTGLFGYIPESRLVYEWVYSYDVSKFPDYVEVVALPNGTLKITFYGLYTEEVLNRSDWLYYSYPTNVTVSVNLGGDLWIWAGPEYPSGIVAADVDPWNFERVVEYLPWAFHYLLFVPSTYYPKSRILEIGAEEFAVFLGNETLAVPPLAYPLYAGTGAFGRVDGFVYVAQPSSERPGRGYRHGCVLQEWFMGTCPFGRPAKPLWDLRNKTAEVCYDNGTCVRVPAGTLFNPPPGYLTNASKTPLGYVAVGTVYIHKPEYNVTVVLPNGTLVFKARWGSLFNFSHPDVYLENGTVFANFSRVSLRVLGNAVVRLNYTVYYRVVVETPLGASETWAKRGSVYRYGGAEAVFDNGTRIVVHSAEVLVDKPLVVRPNYTVYYWVALLAPDGPREFWAERGSAVSYRYVLNYSDKARVVYTASAVVRGPAVVKPNYTVYYKVVVEEAGGSSEHWAEAGSRFSYKPRVYDPGNGTRLTPLGDCEFVVNMSTICRVPYKRQYRVRVAWLNGTWEGWADEGAVLRHFYADSGALGASGAYQLTYEAAVAVDRPGDYAARYRVKGWASLGDQLMVPIPFAKVKACNATFRTDWTGRAEVEAESAGLCKVEADAPPVSPYTAAAAVAAAGGVVLAARRVRRR